jgi:hypothetical protein
MVTRLDAQRAVLVPNNDEDMGMYIQLTISDGAPARFL